MAQRHLDRLSALDAAFLHQESATTHMHIGGVARFDGPPPGISALLEHVRSRLHLVPRYRQKVAGAPLDIGRQRWIDDPTFNLEYHVRHTALPAPGDPARLERLAARIFSQALDRTKPLWELWVVEGLDSGGFALISKTHHALVDGVSGVDLMTTLFDLTPDALEIEGPPVQWHPGPEPSPAQLTASALSGIAEKALSLPLRALAATADPAGSLASAREAVSAVGEVIGAGLTPAPPSPLNVAIGPHRRIVAVAAPLADFKAVRAATGATVNDVVLASVAGGIRRWLHERGKPVEGLELKACVPISTRATDERGALGNRITQVVAPLPIAVADPVRRLDSVRRAMEGIKDSRQALGAEVIAGMQDFAPPTILAQSSRLNFSARAYNILVTNIPGPQVGLFVLGRRMVSMVPVAFLAGDRALAVAAMSYDGIVQFGLIGDYEAMEDLPVLADGILSALDELVAAVT